MQIDAKPFEVAIDSKMLVDLRARLAATRWPAAPRGRPWEFGAEYEYMREIIAYWQDGFDWALQQQRINTFEHYRFSVDGRRVHAAIGRSSQGRLPSLLLMHGRPGSFIEFLEVAKRLSQPERYGRDPRDGANVVALSLPGCGFSDPPESPIGPREIARQWLTVALSDLRLGQFAVHGSDWGAAIGSWMALERPDAVQGLHLTSAIMQPDTAPPAPPLDEEEQAFLARRASRGPWEMGYQIIQGSKPLTLAYGLADSPAGLAAWLLEKYHAWSAARGSNLPPPMDRDDLLAIVSLYWFAGPGPDGWIYRSLLDGTGLRLPPGARIEVPTAICSFANDVSPPSPPRWQERAYRVVGRTRISHGSHFPGLDAPEALTDDLLRFLRSLA